MLLDAPPIDPWLLELIVVRGAARTGSDRSAIVRDVERGLLHRVAPGVYVERAAFVALAPEQAHVVGLRAIVAGLEQSPVFSHWTAAVLHGLPVLRHRLDRVHVTVPSAGERAGADIAAHVFPLDAVEVVQRNGIVATSAARAVIDIAGASELDEGVIVADALLASGVPRAVLQAAVDIAGTRRAAARIREVVAFAHPGAESPAESRTRVTGCRLGVEVPELQHRVRLDGGRSAWLDEFVPEADAALEVDGDQKYLDPVMAPAGAGRVVVAEKRREDEVRTHVRALGRIGWAHSGNVALLRPVLTRIGVHRRRPRPPFEAWCEAAAAAAPRPRH